MATFQPARTLEICCILFDFISLLIKKEKLESEEKQKRKKTIGRCGLVVWAIYIVLDYSVLYGFAATSFDPRQIDIDRRDRALLFREGPGSAGASI